MAHAYALKPDAGFLKRILEEGGGDLKKCFQCATCSVVCGLSDGRKPFPRKEMVWAQWGLKDRLVADPDIWLCHQCNDCSANCPRGARPGDVLAALRHLSVRHYAFPRFLAGWVNQVKYLPILLVIPAVLLGLALVLRRPLEGIAPLAPVLAAMDHHGFYADLFPHWLLIGFFSFFTGLALLAAVFGVARFWRAMKAADREAGECRPASGVLPSILHTLPEILSHDKFGTCAGHRTRRVAHLGAFYGFAALFLVSVWAVVALYVINPLIANDFAYPFGLGNPWKIFANVGCLALIGGCVLALVDRKRNPAEAGASTSFDWIFVWLLLGVAVTGLLTEVLRFVAEPGAYAAKHAERTGAQYVAYAVYFVHLVLVFGLLVYLPYSKFAHVLYRTVALVYAEHSGRNRECRPPALPETGARPQMDWIAETESKAGRSDNPDFGSQTVSP